MNMHFKCANKNWFELNHTLCFEKVGVQTLRKKHTLFSIFIE